MLCCRGKSRKKKKVRTHGKPGERTRKTSFSFWRMSWFWTRGLHKKQGEKKWRRVHTENQVFFIMNQRPTLLMVQLGAVLSCPVPRTTTRQWRCYKWDIGHTAARILRPLKWSEIESERSCCSFLLFSCQAIRKCVPLEHKGLTHYLLALGFMVLFFCFLALVAVLFLQFKLVKPFIGVTTARICM